MEEDRRQALAARGASRLLLVDADTAAPEAADCLEDWIRLPASQDDIDARCRAIATRSMVHNSETPALDPDGVLRVGAGWVSLPPLEARLMSALLDRFGAVVSRDNLSRTGWPTGAPGRNALDVHMLRSEPFVRVATYWKPANCKWFSRPDGPPLLQLPLPRRHRRDSDLSMPVAWLAPSRRRVRNEWARQSEGSHRRYRRR